MKKKEDINLKKCRQGLTGRCGRRKGREKRCNYNITNTQKNQCKENCFTGAVDAAWLWLKNPLWLISNQHHWDESSGKCLSGQHTEVVVVVEEDCVSSWYLKVLSTWYWCRSLKHPSHGNTHMSGARLTRTQKAAQA